MKIDLDLANLDEDSLDLTPLIDVIFLLLTFFILAATFVAPSLEVQLSQARNLASSQGQDHSQTFSIDAGGLIYFEQKVIDQEELKRLLAAGDKETPIIFNVDQAAPFEAFMTVLDEAKSHERHKFLINGKPKSSPEQ